jgi:hypothetical protein
MLVNGRGAGRRHRVRASRMARSARLTDRRERETRGFGAVGASWVVVRRASWPIESWQVADSVTTAPPRSPQRTSVSLQ